MSLAEKLKEEKSPTHAYLFISSNQSEIREGINHIIAISGALTEDVIEINSDEAEEIKVEGIRNFIRLLQLSPFGPMRVGIIYGCERLNASSGNILLKVLEEPPAHVRLILTAATDNILTTIRSRCRIYKTNSKSDQTIDHTFSYQEILSTDLHIAFKKIDSITKEGQTEEFLAGLLDLAEERLNQKHELKIATLIEQIIEAKKRINANVNARLVLENLVIKAKKVW